MPFEIVQLLVIFPACLGFALVNHMRPRLLVRATMGAVLCWAVYLAVYHVMGGEFAPALVASAVAAGYAQVLSHGNRALITPYFIIAVLPVVPGASLFYTMAAAEGGDWASVTNYALRTAQFVLGIAMGGSLVWAAMGIVRNTREAWKARR